MLDWLRRHRRLIVGAALFALLIWALWFAFAGTTHYSSGRVASGFDDKEHVFTLRMSFGLSREPVTRQSMVNLCNSPASATKDECPPAGTADQGTAPVPDRPEIQSTTLAADLSRTDGEGEFPANQITVRADNVGRQGLLITVTADPSKPHEVPEGNYEGEVVVQRSGRVDAVAMRLTAQLDKRGGSTSGRALVALLLGALFGAAVRWLDTSFTPIAKLRRRQKRIGRWVAQREDALPESAVLSYEDAETAVADLDAEGVDDTLGLLVTKEPELLGFSYLIETFRREIDEQDRLAGAGRPRDRAALANAIETESAFVEDLRNRPWPSESAADAAASAAKALENARTFTNALRAQALDQSPELFDATASLARRIVVAGTAGLDKELPAAATPTAVAFGEQRDEEEAASYAELEAPAPRSRTMRKGSKPVPRRFSVWALDNVSWIAIVATAAVVAVVGFQTQFLDNKEFSGSLADFVKLAAWALAIQIAGTTLIQVVGGLTSLGGSGTQSSATASGQ